MAEQQTLLSAIEALQRVVDAHVHNKHPFHNPIASDAQVALRELRAALSRLQAGGGEVVCLPHPAAPAKVLVPKDRVWLACRNPYRHSKGSASIWLSGFQAAEREHGITHNGLALGTDGDGGAG